MRATLAANRHTPEGVAKLPSHNHERYCRRRHNALCFLATSWSGDSIPNKDEAVEAGFFDPQAPPQPHHSPTSHALELLDAFQRLRAFQVR